MPENLEEVREYSSFPGLKDVVSKMKAQAPVEQKVEQPVSVEPKAVSDPGPEDVKQPVAVADEPKDKPKEEPTPTVEEPKAEEKSWDADDSDEPVIQTPSFDFSKLGSALKLEGVKSESDLVSKFTELQTKLQEVESKKAATFEGVPDELKEVIDLAKNGGDWKSYMGASTVNWNEYDPAALYEDQISRLPQFRNPDGTLNETLLNDTLDAVPEVNKILEGNRIIQQKLFEQQQFKNQQIAQARERKERSDKQLLEATRNLSELLPASQYGVEFGAKHSDHLFKGISSGELLNKHLLTADGQYDMKKVARTFALAEYGEKMIKHQSEKAKVVAKKEILDSTQNVQLDTPRTSVAPEGSDKKLSASEKMKNFIAAQRGVGQL